MIQTAIDYASYEGGITLNITPHTSEGELTCLQVGLSRSDIGVKTGEMPLDQLLTRFEEGTRLVKFCQDKLAAAELRIQQLETGASGEPATRPFDPDPSIPAD